MADTKPIGRMHRKWLRDIAETPNGRMAIMGYDGTPWGNALEGLIRRGLVDRGESFEMDLGLYHITAAGRAAIAEKEPAR